MCVWAPTYRCNQHQVIYFFKFRSQQQTCKSDLCDICYYELKKWQTKGGLQKQPLGTAVQESWLYNPISQCTMTWAVSPQGSWKFHQRWHKEGLNTFFIHHSPFIIHGNHLKSQALKFTNVYKHVSSGSPWLLSIPGGALQMLND